MNLIGYFGSYISDGLTADTDLVDLIYEQECLRFPDLKLKRNEFRLVNVSLVCPNGTIVRLNSSEYCRVKFTDTKTLVIPPDYMEVDSIVFEADCASVNCRYLY